MEQGKEWLNEEEQPIENEDELTEATVEETAEEAAEEELESVVEEVVEEVTEDVVEETAEEEIEDVVEEVAEEVIEDEAEEEPEVEIEATEEIEVELEGNEKLQRFIQLLCDLNNEAAELLKSGDMEILFSMNDTVEEMFGIQNDSEAVEYTIIDEDCQIIYKNFNAIITMIQSNEGDEIDAATSEAVKVFVKNIFEANVRIVRAYGLA